MNCAWANAQNRNNKAAIILFECLFLGRRIFLVLECMFDCLNRRNVINVQLKQSDWIVFELICSMVRMRIATLGMMVMVIDSNSLQLEKLAARHADDSLALVHLVPEELVRVVARAARAANDARGKRRRHFDRIGLGAKRAGQQALVGRKDRLAGANGVQLALFKALHLVFKVRQFHVVDVANCGTTNRRRCNRKKKSHKKKKKSV